MRCERCKNNKLDINFTLNTTMHKLTDEKSDEIQKYLNKT